VPFEQYENLELLEGRFKGIEQWNEAIHAKNAAYSMVIFRICNAVFLTCSTGKSKIVIKTIGKIIFTDLCFLLSFLLMTTPFLLLKLPGINNT
jgi:hypothetical protein